ncbi:type III-A CRISPR-associated RAMP protein Csm3 [Carboxydothermus ferrireducens]|uniref:CRISPR system Cms endoribonuclease Csm3 n=1 Tax=Carboxydothermus ferrireducens DSM 11255 TaxID=1119529 RepID=A0ABX2RCF0_9THEO|nr:type III-A CRISPR-associated RAMP protein Csm3 [Carboxydothermus ferrireducens]NYE58844.1 CRISPR-associated protein Csm3 [Carboxydothermus ferrireducens DSM 11255]
MEELKLLGKIVIKGKIKALTGLHIGGAQGNTEIGGVDNSVIKDEEGKPYIPGSSLKGKLRSLLENHEGYLSATKLVLQKKGAEPIRIHICNEPECPVCIIFGRNHGKYTLADNQTELVISNATPTRLYIRDACLDEESIKDIKPNLDLEWTEVKFENSIDRITSAANPRQTERVPRGAEFCFELVYNVLREKDKELFSKVLTAMKLLEDDYLGGSGSRGYGKIMFKDLAVYWKSREEYETGNFSAQPIVVGSLDELMQKNIPQLLK